MNSDIFLEINFLMKLGITAAGTVIDLHDIPF